MTNIYKLKEALKQFAVKWSVDFHDSTRQSLLTIDDYLERAHNASWLTEIKVLPDQERLSLLLDAFVSDPPHYWYDKTREPDLYTAFLIGMVCLDTQEAKEELFVLSLRHAKVGSWIRYAIKPLGALRTIDLIFETIVDTQLLNVILYDFESKFLSYVAPEDREAIIRYYKPLRIKARDKLRPFKSPEEREKYAKELDDMFSHR